MNTPMPDGATISCPKITARTAGDTAQHARKGREDFGAVESGPRSDRKRSSEAFEYAFYESGYTFAHDPQNVKSLDWLYELAESPKHLDKEYVFQKLVSTSHPATGQRRISRIFREASPLVVQTQIPEPLVRRASLDSGEGKKQKHHSKEALAFIKSVLMWGPLPLGFEMHLTERGRPFFFNIITMASSWDDPRFSMPMGWELLITDNIRFVFINPGLRIATLEFPDIKQIPAQTGNASSSTGRPDFKIIQ